PHSARPMSRTTYPPRGALLACGLVAAFEAAVMVFLMALRAGRAPEIAGLESGGNGHIKLSLCACGLVQPLDPRARSRLRGCSHGHSETPVGFRSSPRDHLVARAGA